MRHVYNLIGNMTWYIRKGLSELGNDTLHRVIRNVHETIVQGYQKWNMRHVDRVIKNVT